MRMQDAVNESLTVKRPGWDCTIQPTGGEDFDTFVWSDTKSKFELRHVDLMATDWIPVDKTRFRKKPVEVNAIKYSGDGFHAMSWIREFLKYPEENPAVIRLGVGLVIKTKEGEMIINEGDWIIRGIEGEFYPCKDSIFKKSYEAIE